MCLRDWTLYTTCGHEVRRKLNLCLSVLGLPAHRGAEGKRTTKQDGFCRACIANFRAGRDKIMSDPYVIIYERK
ncbi:hypothetical protein MMC27_006984 [Xylographa pallens]|nr:hypothetical protein [Xylographa pallens]